MDDGQQELRVPLSSISDTVRLIESPGMLKIDAPYLLAHGLPSF